MTTLSASAMVSVWPSRDLTVRAWPSSFSTVPRMRVGVPCGACCAPAGKISSTVNAPASSNFVVIVVPPLVQLLSDVTIPNTSRARRASRRPHFLVSPRFWAPSSPTSSAAAVLNLLEKKKEHLNGLVCALALIKGTNQAVFDDRPQRRGYQHPSGHAGKLRAIIRSRARGSGQKGRTFSLGAP